MESININPGQIVIISTSKATGITEPADKIAARTKLKNGINWNSNLIILKAANPKWLAADNTKARKLLNWDTKASLDETRYQW